MMKNILEKFFKSPTMRGSFGERICSGLKIQNQYESDPYKVAYSYIVQPGDVNILGTLHGGAICTLVDITTTISIIKASETKNVSVNLSTEFLLPAKLNDQLRIENWIRKMGKTLAFTECEIFGKDNKLIAKGTHIKAFIPDDWAKNK